MESLERRHHFFHRHHNPLGRERRFLLHPDDALDQHVALSLALCAWMKVTSGRCAGMVASSSPVNGANDGLDVQIDPGQVGSLVAAEDGAGQAGRTGLIGLGHGGVRMLDGVDGARIGVLDRVAHAAQEANAGIAGVGEHHLFRQPHADHLVVDDVGSHADQRQLADPLPDRFVSRGVRNEVGEALEGDDIASTKIAPHRVVQR